ncbi:MAG: hypothetical protein IT452_20655 [Planctomycetia bacterium]|nr:hypothetical protein [Planctomycetia bacterium]
MPSKGDIEFGALAVREGLTTKPRVDECLQFQEEVEKEGRQTTVDRVMLQKGYLTEAQVFELNKKQGRRVVFCTKCAMKMNVAGLAVGQKIKCPKCGTPNVTPEKITFELVERMKPTGEAVAPSPMPAEGGPVPPPVPGTAEAAGRPPTVKVDLKAAPMTVKMELSAADRKELEAPVPPPLAPAAAGGEKVSDSPKPADVRADGKGKKFAMRRYGKR